MTDAVFNELLQRYATLQTLGVIMWSQIEPTQNNYNVGFITPLLQIMQQVGCTLAISLVVINTNRVSLPAEFVDPNDPSRLKPGMTWRDPSLIAAYAAAVSQVAAALGTYIHDGEVGLISISRLVGITIANEVDVWLLSAGAEATMDFAHFAAKAKEVWTAALLPYYKSRKTTTATGKPTKVNVSIGVALTADGVLEHGLGPSSPLAPLVSVAQLDHFPLTYYAHAKSANFDVVGPETAGQRLRTALYIVRNVTRPGHFLHCQEVGIQSGWSPGDTEHNRTSNATYESQKLILDAMLKVALFEHSSDLKFEIETVFQSWLVDASAAQVAQWGVYYGLTLPGFLEYLATLGLMMHNGTAKPATAVLLSAATKASVGPFACRRRPRPDIVVSSTTTTTMAVSSASPAPVSSATTSVSGASTVAPATGAPSTATPSTAAPGTPSPGTQAPGTASPTAAPATSSSPTSITVSPAQPTQAMTTIPTSSNNSSGPSPSAAGSDESEREKRTAVVITAVVASIVVVGVVVAIVVMWRRQVAARASRNQHQHIDLQSVSEYEILRGRAVV